MTIWIVLAVLATYRLAELFALDLGPYSIFANWRSYLGKRASGKDYHSIWFNLAELFNCPFCLGIWFGVIFAIVVLYFLNPVTKFLIIALAISGGQTFLENRGR